jgi:hypothetical protein
MIGESEILFYLGSLEESKPEADVFSRGNFWIPAL